MKVCIRCNPVSELQVTDEGLRCRIHGDAYVLEEQADSVLVPFLDVDPPADAYLPADTAADVPDETSAE